MASIFTLGSTQPFLLYVNSKNRDEQVEPRTLFRIKLAFPPLHIKRITLLEAIIPNTFYTFRNDAFVTNNNFDFMDSTGVKTAVITPGSYTITSFITELTTQMNAVSADTYTITFNPSTLKLTITSTSADFQILGLTGPNAGNPLDPEDPNTQPLYYLGYEVGVDTAAAAIQLAPLNINIGSPKEIFIKIANFQAPIHSTTNKFTAIFQLSLTEPFGEINFWEHLNKHESGVGVDQRSLNQLYMQLVDENGDTLVSGSDWSCLIRFD